MEASERFGSHNRRGIRTDSTVSLLDVLRANPNLLGEEWATGIDDNREDWAVTAALMRLTRENS